MNPEGSVDHPSAVRLATFFHGLGLPGMVIAGTNGEGPSLSAVEKRDLLRAVALAVDPEFKLILGVATPSLTEAQWLVGQGAKNGASCALVMPPGYFRSASLKGIKDWFVALADSATIPILVYNFPKMTGFVLDGTTMAELARHPRVAGAKDSSGEPGNLAAYRRAFPSDKKLFVGDETLLPQALEAGWNGTISGAANVLPSIMHRLVSDHFAGNHESFETWMQLASPLIAHIRDLDQPATNKSVLRLGGVIAGQTVRLPLEERDGEPLLRKVVETAGGPLTLGSDGYHQSL